MSSKGYSYDPKEMKRKISNRESARRCRMKRDQHMKDLNEHILYFTRKRDEMLVNMQGIMHEYAAVETENMVLRSQKQELEKRLEYAKSVDCGWYEGGDGHVSMLQMGSFEEPWLRQWDQHQFFNSISLMSSSGNFHF